MITGLIGTISVVMASTITETEIYWLTRLDNIRIAVGSTLALWTFIVLGVTAVCIICGGWPNSDKEKRIAQILRRFVIVPVWTVLLCLIVAAVLVPTTKEMCAIKAIPMIINNEQVQELPNKVLELANDWMDELKPNKESE